ncbi:MbtH family NRPS accessory protein [Bacillus sp. WMMC1349]|uniref:MbtH family protein n=1 Tax=Bacillus sp. WMMC1349 TaxID=2736254 RepID=UPI00155223D4|nr:MbtH family NRPS accessory protein [Bacillus sp. WMMC1349]NPC94425.1 MbtH family NRPS accessory protein [Bacillus sp. WMMC1349]
MTNPFETQDGTFVVLKNQEGQYSLWPAFIDAPSGWIAVCDEMSRSACLDYIRSHWTDLQPNSLKAVVHKNS